MKRVVIALVLALGIASVASSIGCSGGGGTTGAKSTKS
jgi:hypothetical protein